MITVDTFPLLGSHAILWLFSPPWGLKLTSASRGVESEEPSFVECAGVQEGLDSFLTTLTSPLFLNVLFTPNFTGATSAISSVWESFECKLSYQFL